MIGSQTSKGDGADSHAIQVARHKKGSHLPLMVYVKRSSEERQHEGCDSSHVSNEHLATTSIQQKKKEDSYETDVSIGAHPLSASVFPARDPWLQTSEIGIFPMPLLYLPFPRRNLYLVAAGLTKKGPRHPCLSQAGPMSQPPP